MRRYYDEEEILESKLDEKPATYIIVYRSWDKVTFKNVPVEGFVMTSVPTTYKTLNMAIRNRRKQNLIPFMWDSLDKIEIYEVPKESGLTVGDYCNMGKQESKEFLTRCLLKYEEDCRDSKVSEEYEEGYRAGRRAYLEEALTQIRFSSKEEAEQRLKSAGKLFGHCYITEDKGVIKLHYYHHNSYSMSVGFIIDLSEGEIDFKRYEVDKGVYFSRAEDLLVQVRDLADLLKEAEEDIEKLVRAKIIKF